MPLATVKAKKLAEGLPAKLTLAMSPERTPDKDAVPLRVADNVVSYSLLLAVKPTIDIVFKVILAVSPVGCVK